MAIFSYKYRLKDRSAKKPLCRHAVAVNHVWNFCNAVQKQAEDKYRAGAPKRRWPSHFDLTYLTAGTSKELDILAVTVGEVCRQFSQSRNAAKRALRFRSSFGTNRALGWIPFRQITVVGNAFEYQGRQYRFFGAKRRPLPLGRKVGAFVEDARGRWYVTFKCEIEDSLPTGSGVVGIDLGLKTLATFSNGDTIPALKHYRKYEAALGVAQRAGNKRRVKAIHAKIANARSDQLHKASTKIVRENSLIVVGNVNAASLKQTKMAKSVSDAGWSMFRRMLEYKASRHQAIYIEAGERFTSQLCSCCGTIPASSPKGMGALGIRHWVCSDCGSSHDRDVNAARNILNVALSAQRRGDESRLNTDKHDSDRGQS